MVDEGAALGGVVAEMVAFAGGATELLGAADVAGVAEALATFLFVADGDGEAGVAAVVGAFAAVVDVVSARGHSHHVATSAMMPMTPIAATMAMAVVCDAAAGDAIADGVTEAGAMGDGRPIAVPLGNVASGSALAVAA